MPALELENVSHRYDRDFAVHEVSFSVDPGRVVCLLGPSGCGKTTLLRLAAGLEPLQSGRIRIGDRLLVEGGRVRQAPPEARGVGFMFQEYALFPHLTVRENVGFGVPRGDRQRDARVLRALRETGLEDVADRYPHTLSGGQQQRIALLRALAPQPKVMLLDEPFSGLDEHLRQQIRLETLSLLQGSAAATLMVSHDLEEAMFLSDHIVVLGRGRVLQVASPAEIYERPGEPYVTRLFGPVNEFAGEVRGGKVETPLGAVAAGVFEDGCPVLVMVRASDVRVLGDGEDPGGSITGRVHSVQPLGPTTEVALMAGEGAAQREVRLRVASGAQPRVGTGTEVRLAVREGCTFVYPRETERAR